jgi:hypothetical protein
MAKTTTINAEKPEQLAFTEDEAQDNLNLWRQVEKTDPQYTKSFQRGGFRGTAINATYLAKRATEVFGPMGIGWGLEVLDEQVLSGALLDEAGTREQVHKVRVKLWYRWGGERGEVQQYGQTLLVGRNRLGVYTDEEAAKKSLTDAMSKCLSLLGFSADVYLGRYDDNKYLQEITAEFAEKREREAHERSRPIAEAQVDELAELLGETGTDVDKFCEFFKIEKLSQLPAEAFERAVRMLAKKKTVAA